METTSTQEDTLFAVWDEVLINGIPASRLMGRAVGVQLWDADLLYDQSIGSRSVTLQEDDLGGPPAAPAAPSVTSR